MLLTLFYLERHVVESENSFWELISIVMLTRLSRRFLLIGHSFAEKRVRLAENFDFFLQKYVAYAILSRKTGGGEQKLFLRINLHSNAHKVIETIFADWTLFCWKTCKISRELRIFLQKYVAYTILSRKTCGGEQKLFLRINLHSNAHKVIETIFADWTLFCWKTCKISRELRIFLQRYVAYTILSRKTCGGEKKLFLRINLDINVHKVIETIFANYTRGGWPGVANYTLVIRRVCGFPKKIMVPVAILCIAVANYIFIV